MIPIGQSKNQLFIILAFVWRIWVVNNERTAQAIRVLPINVGVIPVCAGLVDLQRSAAGEMVEVEDVL